MAADAVSRRLQASAATRTTAMAAAYIATDFRAFERKKHVEVEYSGKPVLLRDTQKGELVALQWGRKEHLGIILSNDANGLGLVFLPYDGTDPHYRVVQPSNNSAVSFGLNWILDLGPASTPFNLRETPRYRTGTVSVASAASFLCVHDKTGYDDEILVNLADFSIGRSEGCVLEISSWKIWDRRSTRENDGSPLFDHREKVD